MGSASELEYLLLLSRELGWLAENDHRDLATKAIDVKRMLTGLIRKLNADR